MAVSTLLLGNTETHLESLCFSKSKRFLTLPVKRDSAEPSQTTLETGDSLPEGAFRAGPSGGCSWPDTTISQPESRGQARGSATTIYAMQMGKLRLRKAN